MNDREIIKELYMKLCIASIKKDEDTLRKILASDYVLIHMTGRTQTKQEYINSVLSGKLKYYDVVHEDMAINIMDNKAILTAKTKTLASPFGANKSWWNLRQDILMEKENGSWVIKQSKASSY